MGDDKTVFERMVDVMRDVGAIGKNQTNDFHRYQFRGIDDVMNGLHGPMVRHGVFVLPEVLESSTEWTSDQKGKPQRVVSLRVAFHFYGNSGDSVTATAMGEAFTNDDKAANQAMSAAFKYAMLQSFCIPTQDMGDADRSSPEVGSIRDPNLVTDEQWGQLRALGGKAKEMFGAEWDRHREQILDGRALDFDLLSTGDAADIIGQLTERLEGEPFGDVEPVSAPVEAPEPPTPVDRGEPLSEPDGPSESNPAYIARVEMMKKPELLDEAAARGLDTAGTAQDLRARIIADVA
jgi:hypothetical protein